MQEVFLVEEQWNHNLQNQTDFVISQVKSVYPSLEIVNPGMHFLGRKYGKAFQLTKKINNRLIVLKQT